MGLIEKLTFLDIHFDQNKKLLTTIWHPNNRMIDEESIKKNVKKVNEAFLKYQPAFVLSDESAREFSYTVDLQLWMIKEGKGVYDKINIKKVFILLPEDIIAQLSLTMLIDSNIKIYPDSKTEFKYISTHEELTNLFECKEFSKELG